jgi:hypothetical protein
MGSASAAARIRVEEGAICRLPVPEVVSAIMPDGISFGSPRRHEFAFSAGQRTMMLRNRTKNAVHRRALSDGLSRLFRAAAGTYWNDSKSLMLQEDFLLA